MRYSGDRTANYSHAEGTGLVGKVMGPDAQGRWHVVTGAVYSALGDTTEVTLEQIVSPEAALRRLQEQEVGS